MLYTIVSLEPKHFTDINLPVKGKGSRKLRLPVFKTTGT
jgi:hypothetical protein